MLPCPLQRLHRPVHLFARLVVVVQPVVHHEHLLHPRRPKAPHRRRVLGVPQLRSRNRPRPVLIRLLDQIPQPRNTVLGVPAHQMINAPPVVVPVLQQRPQLLQRRLLDLLHPRPRPRQNLRHQRVTQIQHRLHPQRHVPISPRHLDQLNIEPLDQLLQLLLVVRIQQIARPRQLLSLPPPPPPPPPPRSPPPPPPPPPPP